LYLVSDDRMMRIAILQCELVDRANVHIVRLAVAGAVVGELAVLDQDLASPPIGENAILIVVEVAVAQREVVPLLTDPGAIRVRHGAPGELDVLNRRIVTLNDPGGFEIGNDRAGDVDLGAAPTHAADGEVVDLEDAVIAVVAAGGVDLDGIASLR